MTDSISRLRCSKCQQEKPTTEFYRNRIRATGYQHQCKQCETVYKRDYYRRLRKIATTAKHTPFIPKEIQDGKMKCLSCNLFQPLNRYYKGRRICNTCYKEQARQKKIQARSEPSLDQSCLTIELRRECDRLKVQIADIQRQIDSVEALKQQQSTLQVKLDEVCKFLASYEED